MKRLPEGGFGGVVDGRMSGGMGSYGVGGGGFGGDGARRVVASGRSTSILPGMEIALRHGTTMSSQAVAAPGIGRSRSVNDGGRKVNTIINSNNNTTTSLRAPTPRLLNPTSTLDRPLSHPVASGPGRDFSRAIHERVNNLRQSYLNSLHINEFETDFETDGEVFTNAADLASRTNDKNENNPISNTAPLPPPPPSTPLPRSISNPSATSSSQQHERSVRNFSLPSYGSPSSKEQQQQQQHSALETRSISGPLRLPSTSSRWDLHDDGGRGDGGGGDGIATTTITTTTPKQNTPRRPLRRVRSKSVNLGRIAEGSEGSRRCGGGRLEWWDEVREVGDLDAGYGKNGEDERAGKYFSVGMPTTTTAAKPASKTTGKPIRKVWKQVEEVEVKATIEDEQQKEEEACARCKSIRRALARNPLCCVDRAKAPRLCFKCWSEALAEGLNKEERDKWLCCVVCGRELMSGDAKRLASRGTVIR